MTGDANNAQPVPSFQSKAPVSVVFFIIIRFAYAGTLYQSGCPPSHSVLKVCNFGRYFFFFLPDSPKNCLYFYLPRDLQLYRVKSYCLSLSYSWHREGQICHRKSFHLRLFWLPIFELRLKQACTPQIKKILLTH